MEKAFFLDRDGVIIEDANYLSKPEQLRLIPGAAQGIALIREKGYKVIVVSNQSGIARGYFTFEDLFKVEKALAGMLAEEGAKVDSWYYCPHHEKGKIAQYAVKCSCRKPLPGLVLQGASEHNIDLKNSALIGDKLSDIECAVNAGIGHFAKVSTGHGSEEKEKGCFPGMIEETSILPAIKKLFKEMQ